MQSGTVNGAYPQHWEADVVGRDGSLIQIRPIVPSDREALQEFHVGQSERSRYFRFFAPLPQLSERDLDRFTQVDYINRVALVAVAHQRILGVGRFDRIDSTDTAEVAFNVSDEEQGRGLGSVLLEHLAAAARERGISQFTADVLPENVKMLRVFRDAGYHIRQEVDDGVITVDFAIDPTMRQLAVLAEREHRSESRAMRFLYRPDAVVAVFAGPEGPHFQQAISPGLPAEVTVVTSADQLAQLAASGDADPTPRGFELALVAMDPQDFVGSLPTLRALGVRMVVLYSDGFGFGLGQITHSQLRSELRAHHIRLVGPRSFGVVVETSSGAVLAATAHEEFNRSLRQSWGDTGAALHHDTDTVRPVAVFAQSAAGARALMGQLKNSRLPPHSLISAGHRLDISGNDAMQYLATDDEVRVVTMGFESIGNPRKFNRIARRLTAKVPVVATLQGESGQVLPTAVATPTQPSRRKSLEQLMAQAGVFLAQSTTEQVQWAMVLATGRLPRGSRIQLLTNSRTQVSLAREVVSQTSEQIAVSLNTTCLDPMVNEEDLLAELEKTMASDQWDVLIISYGEFAVNHTDALLRALIEYMTHDQRLIILVDDVHNSMITPQLPAIAGLVHAIKGAEVAIEYGTRADHDEDYPIPGGIDRVKARQLVDNFLASSHHESGQPVAAPRETIQQILEAYGISLLPTIRVNTFDEAVAAAEDLGWPVALKSVDPVVRHRLDVGGVILNISDELEMRQAWQDLHDQLIAIGRTETACDVQPMVEVGVACVLSGEEDPRYGPIISFGLGGDASELLGDIAYRVPPLRTEDVQGMVHSVKASRRLRGDQGLPAANVDALYDLIARLSLLKEDLAQVQHIKLHPVLVGPGNSYPLDAHMSLMASTRGDLVRRSLPR